MVYHHVINDIQHKRSAHRRHMRSPRAIAKAGWKDILLCCVGLRRHYRVNGHSLFPLLHDGQRVFVKKTFTLAVGNIIVARHPSARLHIIKKITSVAPDCSVEIEGTLAESSGSHTFGRILPDDVLGVVVSAVNAPRTAARTQ